MLEHGQTSYANNPRASMCPPYQFTDPLQWAHQSNGSAWQVRKLAHIAKLLSMHTLP